MAISERLKQIKEERDQREIADWRGQTGAELPYTGSKEQIQAGMTGEKVARQLFGVTPTQAGDINRQVLEERQAMLQQQDPVSTRIKQGANVQTRAARAAAQSQGRDISTQEQAQIQRSAESDIADQLYANRMTNLNALARSGGAASSNILSTVMGYQGLETAGQQPVMPSSGMTVICTELHRQGYLSDEIMLKDAEFGRQLREELPHVYSGYMAWAPTVVGWMRKSKVVTSIVAVFGIRWAKYMAGDFSPIGAVINTIGMPICGMIGKVISWNTKLQKA